MILEAILGFMLEVFGELIGESLMELSLSLIHI